MNPIINTAQIGVGYWGPNLLRNLMTNHNCDVKIVVDLSRRRRAFVRELYPHIHVSDELSDIIKDQEIDAVVIATPVITHYDLAIAAMKSGKHILVEKPMAMTVDEVKKIDLLAKQNELVAMVGHTFLFNSAVRYIKTLIDSGELGDIRYIYSHRVNLGRVRNDVDALWNFAPHDISIIQYWLDDLEPVNVNRQGMAYVQKGIEDVVFLNMTYPNDVLVNIHVSWLDPHKIRRMTIVGSKKMVVYDDISDNKITIYDKGIDNIAMLGENMDFDNPDSLSFRHRSGDIIIPEVNYIEPLKVEISHFMDCIINNTPCITSANHAGKVVKILEMAE